MAPRKKKEAKYKKLLRKIYYTPKEAASFGGIQRLKEASHNKGKKTKDQTSSLVVLYTGYLYPTQTCTAPFLTK